MEEHVPEFVTTAGLGYLLMAYLQALGTANGLAVTICCRPWVLLMA